MQSRLHIKTLVVIFLAATLAGFLDASYLTVKHYANATPPCSVLHGCETVLTSSYATIGKVPISLVGSAYYLVLFLLSVLFLDTKKEIIIRRAAQLTWIGLITSAGLVSLQLFVIHAICLYCMASAIISTLLFILGMLILKRLNSGVETNEKNKLESRNRKYNILGP